LRKHYDNGFGSAVVASASNLGPIIPPSAAMIVYALMAGSSVSVGGLFMAGVVPGILLTVGMMGLATWMSYRSGYEPAQEKPQCAALRRDHGADAASFEAGRLHAQ
jgi:TRAP-type C4-dicarboxylate transport system permease large subunit